VRRARDGTLILGGGFAGAYVARLLGRSGATIVSPENFMLYTPLLPEAASGTLEPRHAVVPVRVMAPQAELILGRADGIDADARTVRVETDTERQLTFVFVGAGYAGVEALAELSDLVRDALRWYPSLREARQRWVLVDAAPKILPDIPPRLGDYAARELAHRGVEIRTSTTLQSIDAGEAVLSDGERIQTATLVWTAGVKPAPLLPELGLPLDDRGRVIVDGTLQVDGRRDVWALGDCARVPNAATPGSFDPPTCQHALRQARRLAHNLQGDVQAYRYRMLGQVATLGRYKGIADVLGLRLSGFPGWFVTRTYHLYHLPLLTRKLRVVTDWTVSLLFRRDVAELGDV
jgi:NADH:quinone reductase (non-electrogenic)